MKYVRSDMRLAAFYYILGAYGRSGMTPGDLSVWTGYSKTHCYRVLTQLVRLGRVIRVPCTTGEKGQYYLYSIAEENHWVQNHEVLGSVYRTFQRYRKDAPQ